MVEISKQAVYKNRLKQKKDLIIIAKVIELIQKERKENKSMSCRKIYSKCIDQVEVGRDKFISIGLTNGFKVITKRNPVKTTYGQKIEIYPDLVTGLKINSINKVYQIDITYIWVEIRHYYIIDIIDVYSRRLLALHVANNLRSEEVIKALKQIIEVRTKEEIVGCIIHSDQGSQFISNLYKERTNEYQLIKSMCDKPQKNSYVERLHGILKYEYFFEYSITSKNIQSMAKKIKRNYNDERPHISLGNKTPKQYEEYLMSIPIEQRPKLQIYDWK